MSSIKFQQPSALSQHLPAQCMPAQCMPGGWQIINRLGALWQRLLLAAAIRRERIDLADLDDRMLRDLGLSADAARAEAARPVWDLPHFTWRRG